MPDYKSQGKTNNDVAKISSLASTANQECIESPVYENHNG